MCLIDGCWTRLLAYAGIFALVWVVGAIASLFGD